MEPAVPPAGKPLRILFVEDSPDVLNLLRIELEDLGYSVLMARDGERGLEIATRELPDVIVSDIKMPRFDGYELIKHVRRIPPLAKIPAIALTGLGRNQDVEKAIHAGYNAHLCKPVDLNELVSLIEKLVSR
jgi:two-component system CheB/CheR fusion protein